MPTRYSPGKVLGHLQRPHNWMVIWFLGPNDTTTVFWNAHWYFLEF